MDLKPIPAAKQIEQLNQQLLQAYIKKHDAEAKAKEADSAIQAIRNLLSGIPLGQQLMLAIQAETPPQAVPKS